MRPLRGRYRTAIAACVQLATAGGAALGQTFAGFYGAEDWRLPFVCVASFACALALAVALAVAEPPRDDGGQTDDGGTGGTGEEAPPALERCFRHEI